MKRWTFLIVTLLLSLILAACNTEDVELPQSKEAYEAEIQARLDELNQQIEALKSEAEQKVGEEINAEDIDQMIAELEAQAAGATQELEELGAASEDAWEDLKPGLEAAIDELDLALQEALANFEEN